MTHNDLFHLKCLSTDINATKAELRNAVDELLCEIEKLQKEKELAVKPPSSRPQYLAKR